LKTRFPKATHTECKRFYVCVKHKEHEAAQRLESWLQWRADCGLKLTADPTKTIDASSDGCREYNDNFTQNDQEIWNAAAKWAIELENKGSPIDSKDTDLPQIICAY
jgi:hypothetical protein